MTKNLEIKHFIHYQPQAQPKPKALLALLEFHAPHNALILCYETEECELLARFLARYDFQTISVSENSQKKLKDAISMLEQNKPIFVILQNSFIDKISLENIDFLINYDFIERPQNYEKILLAKKVANIVSDKESMALAQIKSTIKVSFIEEKLPTQEEVLALSANRIIKNLSKEAKEIELAQYEDLAKAMMVNEDSYIVLAFLLKNYFTPKPKKEEFQTYHAKEYKTVETIEKIEETENTDDEHSRLYINLGKRDGHENLASLANFIGKKANVDLGHFTGSGILRDHSAHIDVDKEVAEKIVLAVNGQPKVKNDEEDSDTLICQIAKFTPKPRARFNQGPRPYHKRRLPNKNFGSKRTKTY